MRDIPIHPSARPERLRAALTVSLRARRIPGWWLYEGPEQARRWLAYHEIWSPSRTEEVMAGVYRQAFAAAAAAMSLGQVADRTGGEVHVVGLGCGGGRKDAALLRTVSQRLVDREPGTLRYFPLDASAELVTQAAAQVVASLPMPCLPMHPLVADLGAYPDLSDWLALGEGAHAARLFTCFGMTPNFDHAAFPRYLRGLLRAGDGLLISANLSPGGMAADAATILAQYDNAPARAWYAGALENLGLGQGAYELEVLAHALDDQGSIWRVVVEARMRLDEALSVGGSRIALGQGERLQVFYSNRFTQDAFTAVLEEAGLELTQSWLHVGGEEGVFFCRIRAGA